ncbi:NADH-quinone oxidoreductase subunit NuoH [Bdellovibrionota bacterium FG-1]
MDSFRDYFLNNFETATMVIKVLVMFLMLLSVAPLMAWVERRGSALIQNRLGPNRLGPLGLFQSVADAIKFLFKEDIVSTHVTKFYYMLAPVISFVPAVLTFAVIPYASQIQIDNHLIHFQVADLNVGVLYIFAVASLGVYGIIMGGWASNNKYALMGALRSSSQMISYELSMGLSVVGIIMAYSSVHLGDIAVGQAETLLKLGPFSIDKWGVLIQPVGFLIFLTAAFAETNRLPFDLPEGESELIAGYHLEYGSMKFAMYQMAEYQNMATACGLFVALYFGGYHGLGWLHQLIVAHSQLSAMAAEWLRVILEMMAFLSKLVFFMWFFVWVRWTIPRFRYDHLMDLGWKVMLPLSLVNIFVSGVLIYYKVI